MRVKFKSWVWLGFALTQLLLVIVGANQWVNWEKLGKLGAGLSFYSDMTGASSGYGFFAPGVGSQLRAKFEVFQEGVPPQEVLLETGHSQESDLRVGNIVGWFWREDSTRDLKRAMAASWAGKMFGRFPKADQVVVRVESYELVSMKEYREGKRPGWKPFYRATFEHRKPKEARHAKSSAKVGV